MKSEVSKKLYISTSYIVNDIKRKDRIMAGHGQQDYPSISAIGVHNRSQDDIIAKRTKIQELQNPGHGAVVAHSPSEIRLFNLDGTVKVNGQNPYA